MTTATIKPGWLSGLSSTRIKLQNQIGEWDTMDCAVDMTVVLLLLYAGDFWYLQRPIIVLCSAAIFFRRLRYSDTFWLIITAVLAASSYYNWYSIDNHKYLLIYWSFAIYLSLQVMNPTKVISTSSRLLIGFAFLFATLQKVISPDYLDGTFFRYSLLLDERFTSITALFGQLSHFSFVQNHQAIDELLHYASTLEAVTLQDTVQIHQLADLLTWWTLGIEGVIALMFLAPPTTILAKWRDIPLLIFLLSTYIFAPVIGFGWILGIMGAVQARSEPKQARLFYVIVFFILQIFLVPWQTIVTSLMSS